VFDLARRNDFAAARAAVPARRTGDDALSADADEFIEPDCLGRHRAAPALARPTEPAALLMRRPSIARGDDGAPGGMAQTP
jgi:hypothetical protein